MKRSSRHSKESKLVPWFLSLLFCVLNGSSLFVCGMFFVVIEGLLALDKDSFSSFTLYIFKYSVRRNRFFLYFDKRATIQIDSLPWVSCPTRFKSPSYEKRV